MSGVTWEPVEAGFEYKCQCSDCDQAPALENPWRWLLYASPEQIGIQHVSDEDDDRYVELPPDVRLCRAVIAQPVQDVHDALDDDDDEYTCAEVPQPADYDERGSMAVAGYMMAMLFGGALGFITGWIARLWIVG